MSYNSAGLEFDLFCTRDFFSMIEKYENDTQFYPDAVRYHTSRANYWLREAGIN